MSGPSGFNPVANDLCTSFTDTNGGLSTQNDFNPSTGSLYFLSNDKQTYPPGDYTFKLKVIVGNKEAQVTYVMTLIDNCGVSPLVMGTNPFVGPFTLDIGVTQITVTYDINGLAYSSLGIDCGPLAIEFMNSADNTDIEPLIFSEGTDGSLLQFLMGVVPLENYSLAGDYNLKWRIYLIDYPANEIYSPPFLVQVVDTCNPHVSGYATSVIPSTFVDQYYTVSTPAATYVIPEFQASPAFCQDRLVYSFDVNTDSTPIAVGAGGSAVSFDPATREFTFYYTGSNDLAGNSPAGTQYLLTVTGTMDSGASNSNDVVLYIKNPCLDSGVTNLGSLSLPDFTYVLESNDDTWVHDPLVLTSSLTGAQIDNLCGALVYEASADNANFNGGQLDQFLTYVPSTFTHTIFLDDRSYIPGPYLYKVRIYFANYDPYSSGQPYQSKEAQGLIYLVDPCLNPTSLSTASESFTSIVQYGVPTVFNYPALTAVPSQCVNDAVFSCQVLSTPAGYVSTNDLCSTFTESNGSIQTSVAFNPTSGQYNFVTNDNVNYPAGNYLLFISATVGSKIQTVSLMLTIQDACSQQTITIVEPNAFTTGPFYYELGASQPTQISYDINSLVVPSIYDCGNLILTFLNADDSALDAVVFSENRNVANNYKFIVGQGPLTNIAKAGPYPLKFKVRYADAPANEAESSVFIVHVIDPCLPHEAWTSPVISVPTLLPQEYYISADTKVYTVPEFTVQPTICQTRITYSFDPATDSSPSIIGVGGPAATFSSGSRVFSFYTVDGNLADPVTGTVYQLTVTATLPSGQTQTGTVQLTLKNPCY